VGALLLLLGLAARDLGARLAARSSTSPGLSSAGSETPSKINRRQLIPLAGAPIMIGGAAVIVATFVGIFFQLGDQAAGRLVLITTAAAIVFVVARIPFLMRAKPEKPVEAPKPAKAPKSANMSEDQLSHPRRPRSQAKRQPILFASNQTRKANGSSPSNSSEARQQIPQYDEREPDVVADEATDLGSWDNWPSFFDSDEPIQEGLLERLLAEDPNWHSNGSKPPGEDRVLDESVAIDKAPDPEKSSDAALADSPAIAELPDFHASKKVET